MHNRKKKQKKQSTLVLIRNYNFVLIPKIIMNLRRNDTLQNFRKIVGLNFEKVLPIQQLVMN